MIGSGAILLSPPLFSLRGIAESNSGSGFDRSYADEMPDMLVSCLAKKQNDVHSLGSWGKLGSYYLVCGK